MSQEPFWRGRRSVKLFRHQLHPWHHRRLIKITKNNISFNFSCYLHTIQGKKDDSLHLNEDQKVSIKSSLFTFTLHFSYQNIMVEELPSLSHVWRFRWRMRWRASPRLRWSPAGVSGVTAAQSCTFDPWICDTNFNYLCVFWNAHSLYSSGAAIGNEERVRHTAQCGKMW